jgi:hypothetical protein
MRARDGWIIYHQEISKIQNSNEWEEFTAVGYAVCVVCHYLTVPANPVYSVLVLLGEMRDGAYVHFQYP